MKISACWITKNEAETIALSIGSVKDIVDELIVVDTGSVDDTVAIAESMGARIEHFQWISDFAAARNYAISFATGDIIFFLDADEWFLPALNEQDKQKIINLYTDNPKLDIIQTKISNIDKATGICMSTGSVDRVLRNRPNLRYHNKIHELLRKDDGTINFTYLMPEWDLRHTGYSEADREHKMERNIAMLKDALKATNDEQERYVLHCYLLRENSRVGNYLESAAHLCEILKSPKRLKQAAKDYNINFVDIIYTAMDVAEQMRIVVSRKDLWDKLVLFMGKFYPDYPGTPVFPLLFQAKFDFKEDRFLKNLDAAIEAAHKLPYSAVTVYKNVETVMYSYAALACWRRGNKLKALDYAISAITAHEMYSTSTVHLLLDCIKGQSTGDIIMFINSLFDVDDPRKLNFLVNSTQMDGFQEVYMYYLKKQIESGTASTGSFLYLMLMLEKYDESVESALSREDQEDADEEVIGQHLCLAAICSNNEPIFRDHGKHLGRYQRVLDAYFTGETFAFTQEEEATLRLMYERIAFAQGLAAADGFRAVFRGNPRFCYMVKAGYCLQNGLYEELLLEDRSAIEPDDIGCYRLIIQGCLADRRYAEAVQFIREFFDREIIEQDMLHTLLAIAEVDKSEAGKDARKLYTTYIAIFDSVIDLRDVFRSKVAYNDYNKNQIKSLGKTTVAQFAKDLAADKARVVTGELLQVTKEAAGVFADQEYYAMAMQCYRLLVAKEQDTQVNRENLARMYKRLGNMVLSQHVEKML